MISSREPELWCVDLRVTAPALLVMEQATPRLSDEERHRADALSDAATRDEWLAAHIALRLLIERACGDTWRKIPFARQERGKPVLAGAPIAFSLSHAPGIALIGLTTAMAIGVDVERPRTVRIDAARRQRIRDAGQGASQAPLPETDDAAFLQAWVRLEAFAKAEGCGVGRLLTRLGIMGQGSRSLPAPGEMSARAAALVAESGVGPVHDLQLGEAVFAAVACAESPAAPWVTQLTGNLDDLQT